MLKSEKQQFIQDLEKVYISSESIVVTHYHGLTVAQITKLRCALRAEGAKFKIVKNTLSKIAADKAGVGQLAALCTGPTAIAYSSDPILAAKVVVDFTKSNEQLQIIGGFISKQLLNVSAVKQIAALPSLDELRGRLLAMLSAPATSMVRVSSAPATAIVRLLNAYVAKNN